MKQSYLKISALLCLFFVSVLFSKNIQAQTIISTSGFANNNANAIVTFNFTNNNATSFVITDIAGICEYAGTTSVSAYYKPSAINGLTGLIDAANGWNQFGVASINAIDNTITTSTQPFMSGLSLVIPPGATYGICVQAILTTTNFPNLRYSTVPAGTYTFSAGGGVLTTGTNIGYGGIEVPNEPTFNPRAFMGKVTIYPAIACTGTPAPGNTIASAVAVCPAKNFNLTLQNQPLPGTTGITYQWQSSSSTSGPWTNIPGAIFNNLTISQNIATYYRAMVSCGANSGSSTPVLVGLNLAKNCYCDAGTTSTVFEKIASVQFGSINRISTSTAGYEDFTTDTATIEKLATTALNISLSAGYIGDEVLAWIDYNQDGDFYDAGEQVYNATGAGPFSGSITIPATALTGYTRMRIRMHDTNAGIPNATPCDYSTYGQVEDYTINIVPCKPAIITTQPSNKTIECGGSTSFSLTATGTALTYLWEQRNNATAQWNNILNGGVYSGANTSTLTITNAPVSMNGYQYRAVFAGACSGTDVSNFATLNVNILVPALSPVSSIVQCNNPSQTAQQFSIMNVPAPVIATFTSAATVNITDDFPTGVISPITVSGIPAGANISEIRVTLNNVTHTYVGDLDINLIAPNNGNLNLVGSLDDGNGTNSSNDFINTVISSLGSKPLSAATAPRTGTFAADALAGYGPVGNAQNVSDWSGLKSTINGVWTLAVADFYNGDIGSINSWSISFVYGIPATGIWAPVAGLFTNAAATIPYNGSPINTVYALPGVTTNYSVTVTTPTCVSSPLIVPVIVNNPVTGTSTVNNQTVCEGGTVSFTSSAPATGSPVLHQWKVSTDGGLSFTNLSNAGIYSGASSATLSISAAAINMNGYKYKDSLYVNVCNSFVNTNAATLTVNPTPVVTLNASATEIFPGQTSTLTATVSPNAAASYVWYRNGILVPGATTNTTLADIDALGLYTVIATDVKGCKNVSAAKEIKSSSTDILFIYPSPNTGQFQVRYFSQPGNGNLSRFINIYDNKGARIFSKPYIVNQPYSRLNVDLKNHGKGIYNVELTDSEGNRLKTGRVVIL